MLLRKLKDSEEKAGMMILKHSEANLKRYLLLYLFCLVFTRVQLQKVVASIIDETKNTSSVAECDDDDVLEATSRD